MGLLSRGWIAAVCGLSFACLTAFKVLAQTDVAEKKCIEAKLDVYYLQDGTGSFVSSLTLLRREIGGILNDLATTFPGSRFGFGIVDDSPKAVGAIVKNAFCYKKIRGLDSKYDDIVTYMKQTFYPGGGDSERSEDSLSAMTVAALDDTIGWRDYDVDPADNKAVIRVFLLITDALFQYTDPKLPGLSSLGGVPCPGHAPTAGSSVTANYACGVDDYATLETAAAALKKRNIIPLILSRRDTLDGWRLLLEYIGVNGAVDELDSGSTNIVEAVKEGMKKVVCEIATTTSSTSSTSSMSSTPATTASTPETSGSSSGALASTAAESSDGKGASAAAISAASGGAVLLLAAAGYGTWRMLQQSDVTVDAEFEGDPDHEDEDPDREVMHLAFAEDFS